MVVIDASMLLLLIQPDIRTTPDSSGQPIQHAKERVQGLIADLEQAQLKVLVPTPALSEALVRSNPAVSQHIVDTLNRHSAFAIASFDERAAIEVAAMTRGAPKRKQVKPDAATTYAKLKYDRQIVAIARVNGATAIYSDDGDVKALGKTHGIEVIGLADLPVPADKQQRDMFIDSDAPDESSPG